MNSVPPRVSDLSAKARAAGVRFVRPRSRDTYISISASVRVALPNEPSKTPMRGNDRFGGRKVTKAALVQKVTFSTLVINSRFGKLLVAQGSLKSFPPRISFPKKSSLVWRLVPIRSRLFTNLTLAAGLPGGSVHPSVKRKGSACAAVFTEKN